MQKRVVELTRQFVAMIAAFAIILGSTASPIYAATKDGQDNDNKKNASPIKHVVVIFQENVSFDHYFGTYPNALNNSSSEPQFHARRNTPTVNGLSFFLLNKNPNLNPANGIGATNPFRLNRSQALTNDQNHNYGPEQQGFDKGLMDIYPKTVGTAGPPPAAPPAIVNTTGLVMGYYDGNTVTAYWNYAQHFAMSDNSFSTGFGPSTPGALNLISGQTNGAIATLNGTGGNETDGGNGSLTVIGDPDPIGDICASPTRGQATMGGQNIGNLLNAAGVSWGWFQGGFDLTITNSNGTTGCKRSTTGVAGQTATDYSPHHAPFQYYASTANLKHTRPASIAEIGHNGPANHSYDINDWFNAVSNGNLPAVSYLKALSAQDGHPGNSDPLDEQIFVVNVINALQKSADWNSTAVFILYDDSDGWYDHQVSPVLNQSTSPADALTGPGTCGDGTLALAGLTINGVANPHAQGRCGFGPRQPLIVVSPWAKENFVDHSISDQTSVLRFIEDTFIGGTRIGQGSFDAFSNPLTQMFDFDSRRGDDSRTLILDPTTGVQVGGDQDDHGGDNGNSGKN